VVIAVKIFSGAVYYTIIGALIVIWLLTKYVFKFGSSVTDTVLITELIVALILTFGGRYRKKKLKDVEKVS
jgi:hypothetical protein